VFGVEVGSAQTGVQVVSQRLQSLHGGQQLALVLRTHKSKQMIWFIDNPILNYLMPKFNSTKIPCYFALYNH